jgi:hypothetical protein
MSAKLSLVTPRDIVQSGANLGVMVQANAEEDLKRGFEQCAEVLVRTGGAFLRYLFGTGRVAE